MDEASGGRGGRRREMDEARKWTTCRCDCTSERASALTHRTLFIPMTTPSSLVQAWPVLPRLRHLAIVLGPPHTTVELYSPGARVRAVLWLRRRIPLDCAACGGAWSALRASTARERKGERKIEANSSRAIVCVRVSSCSDLLLLPDATGHTHNGRSLSFDNRELVLES